MGIFSSLFSGNSSKNSSSSSSVSSTPAEQEPEEVRRPSFLSQLSIGMPLDVSIPKGKKLLSGRLASFDSHRLVLERKPGQLAFNVYEPGTSVYVRGFDDGAMAFDIKGVVTESSRMRFVVEKLEGVAYSDQRNNFRLILDIPACLYSQNDKRLKNPEPCQLVDISATGACFQSEYIHETGETCYLKIPFDDHFAVESDVPRMILGQIIRTTQSPSGAFRYGFLFAQLEERETSALVRLLFQIQMGNRRERARRRSENSRF